MDFNLNHELYYEDPMKKRFSIGHVESEFLEGGNRIHVVVRAIPIKDEDDFDDVTDVDEEEYDDIEEDYYEYEDEYNNPIRRRLKLIAFYYYKYFTFQHVAGVLKNLRKRARILEGIGFLNLTPLIVESEKLRDEYLAKYLELIEINKNNFTIETEIIDEDMLEPFPVEDVKLTTSVEYDKNRQVLVFKTYDDFFYVPIMDLKDSLKALPEHLYIPLFKEYFIVSGILNVLKMVIELFFNKQPNIADTKLQEYKKLLNLQWNDLYSLRAIPKKLTGSVDFTKLDLELDGINNYKILE